MNMKNSIFIIFISIFITCSVSAQRKVGSSPNAIDHPAIFWPGSPRTLALGYFNIIGDGMHPDFKANPALVADVRGYYFSAATYVTPYPLLTSYNGENYFYQVRAGKNISDNASVLFSSTTLNVKYGFEEVTYESGFVSPGISNSYDYEFRSSAFSTSLAYRFNSGILIGMTGTYHKWENAFNNNTLVYSFDAFKLDIGAEIRYAIIIWPDNSNNNSQKFYSKWHRDRVPGINVAAALKNIGSDIDAGYDKRIDLPLEMRVGASWLIAHRDEFGVELFGNFMGEMATSDNYSDYYSGELRRFSHSQALELSFINLLQLRLGHFNIAGNNRALTWGFSIGPPFIKIEYAKIDDFDLFDKYSNSGINGRDMLTLSFNHSLR